MMQLVCNGVALDLYDNAGLQFTHKNPLFAFDDLECERTTQFKLPSTPTNDRAFSLARIPAYAGTGMRRRFSTQLQAGTVVKNGYLYVASFDGKDYAAIFVTGELVGLQAIKNAGNIGDILGDNKDLSFWGTENTHSPIRGFFDVVKYGQAYGSPYYVPSVKLADLINNAVIKLGITAQQVTGEYRILLKEPQAPSGELPYTMSYGQAWGSWGTTNVLNTLTPSNDDTLAAFIQTAAKMIRYQADNVPHYLYGFIKQFYSAYNDINLVFPSDLGEDWVLMSFPTDCGQTPEQDPEVYKPGGLEYGYTLGVFLGNYSFNYDSQTEQPVYSGEPLAGRTVTVPKGTLFVLLNARTMFDFYTLGAKGWYEPYSSEPLSLTIAEKKAVQGNRIGLYNNYPDVTLVDLFKTYAALTGTVLNYDEANGLTYDTLNTSGWSVVDLTSRLMARKEVQRTFADYGQKNTISFEGDDTQYESDKLTRIYTIDNDNIEAEKELQEIPFSEGSVNPPNTRLYIRNTEEDLAPSAYVLGVMQPDVAVMQRATLPQCAGLQGLCTASTQFKVKVRMSALEYFGVTAKTLLQVDGTRYVWTERSWQKNEAQFTLAKIA